MLIIEYKGKIWRYHVRDFPPKEYCEPVAASTIHAQLEQDGSIYVFLPGTKCPVSEKLPQPKGYPLEQGLFKNGRNLLI